MAEFFSTTQEAAKWVTMATAQKFVDAPINIGSLCAQGQGVLLDLQDFIRNFWAACRICRKIEHIKQRGQAKCIVQSEISS